MAWIDETASRSRLRREVADALSLFILVTVAVLLASWIDGLSRTPAEASLIGATIAGVHVASLLIVRGYHAAWRLFSAAEAIRCGVTALFASAVATAIWFSFLPSAGWIVVAASAVLASVGIRTMARLSYSHGWFSDTATIRNPVRRVEPSCGSRKKTALAIGYGENAETFLRNRRRRDADFEIVGIVSIEPLARASSLQGIPVLGSLNEIDAIVATLARKQHDPDILILTCDEMAGRSVTDILSCVDTVQADIAWLPRVDRLDTDDGAELPPLAFEDILPRPAQSFDARACKGLVSGATVLVTGAGGAIGSELVRQIATLSPGELILTDSSEHALHEIGREMGVSFPNVPFTCRILDVRDEGAVMNLMHRNKPAFVFHAAALKHVPVVEGQPCEGVITNVVGCQNVADAAIAVGAQAMVMVSTDKAVNPASVMGATKRLAETYCQAMDADRFDRGGDTRFVTVRFGNVHGPAVPLFQKQIARGGALTVTHPDVERFFMTIPEASRLVLEAMRIGMDDEEVHQGIFVLDMGKPVKIVDLARQVIRLSGRRPDIDVKIVYTGLRPGEKLCEEPMHEKENLLPTMHQSLMVVQPRFVQREAVQNQISLIATAARQGNEEEVVRLLKVYIPEFGITADEERKAREDMMNTAVLREHAS